MNSFVNVVKAELFKSTKKKRTYIMASLLWFVVPILALIVGKIAFITLNTNFVENSGVSALAIVQAIASPYGIARISLVLPSLISPSFFIIVIALLAALYIGEERSQNMWKTTMVAQPNRVAVMSGKFFVAMLLYGVMLLGAFLFSFIFGSFGTLFLPTNLSGEWLYLAQMYSLLWLFGIAGMSFAFLMIWLFKNISLGMISVFFLPILLESIYRIYATVIGFKPINRFNFILQGLKLNHTLENLPKYFFTTNFYAPARNPLTSLVSEFGGDFANNSDFGQLSEIIGRNLTLAHSTKVMAGYAIFFFIILLWSFRKRDVA